MSQTKLRASRAIFILYVAVLMVMAGVLVLWLASLFVPDILSTGRALIAGQVDTRILANQIGAALVLGGVWWVVRKAMPGAETGAVFGIWFCVLSLAAFAIAAVSAVLGAYR